MPKLIDADEAKEILKHLLYETAMNNLDIADIYEDIIENRLDTWVELIPTADAEPVRHGHWSERQSGELYNLPFSVVCCSVCGNPQSTETPYCSNCKAKMDEAIDTPTDPVAK